MCVWLSHIRWFVSPNSHAIHVNQPKIVCIAFKSKNFDIDFNLKWDASHGIEYINHFIEMICVITKSLWNSRWFCIYFGFCLKFHYVNAFVCSLLWRSVICFVLSHPLMTCSSKLFLHTTSFNLFAYNF